MKPYHERTRCPKCACQSASTRYHCDGGEEYIKRVCLRCEFAWQEACLDLPAQERAEADSELLARNIKELTEGEKRERRKLQCRAAMGKWLDKKGREAKQG